MERTNPKIVKLYIVEEQEIYRELYKSFLPTRVPAELLEVSGRGSAGVLNRAVSHYYPDVLLMGIKRLDVGVVEELEQVRTDYPGTGIVLLLAFCNSQDTELLRRLALKGEGGIAVFLKQSVDQVDQLCRAILAVAQGQVILDPPLAGFLFAEKPECPLLKQLTARELEILSLLAQGYTNSSIADSLFIDIKTVEHHLNSMYSKLKTDPGFNDKHLRVTAARLYIEAMSELNVREDSLARAVSHRR